MKMNRANYLLMWLVQTKRVFIYNNQLPVLIPADPYNCQLDSELYSKPGNPTIPQVALNLLPLGSAEIPVYGIPIGSRTPIGYMSASIYCTDCTLRGTKTQPAFWK